MCYLKYLLHLVFGLILEDNQFNTQALIISNSNIKIVYFTYNIKLGFCLKKTDIGI